MAKIDSESGKALSSRVTKEDIKKGLSCVGLRKGDIVLTHSSLSSFGYVEGGAAAVIDALIEVVGDKGTVVMPTFTWDSFHDKENIVFDVVNKPSETGKITEVFRKRKGVSRSVHICHSVAAIGAHARDVMGDGVSSFGKGSSLYELYKLNSWNLLLGVSFTMCTVLHTVEELMQVPYRYYRDYKNSKVLLPDGTLVSSKSMEYLRKPNAEQGDINRNNFAEMEKIFSAEGVLNTCEIGKAKVMNARIRDIVDITRTYLEKDINFLINKG